MPGEHNSKDPCKYHNKAKAWKNEFNLLDELVMSKLREIRFRPPILVVWHDSVNLAPGSA